jgi:hypothetical protein
MDLPLIERGMRILAEHVNRISAEVRANAITAISGGRFQRTPSGTSIQFDKGFFGGGGGVAPSIPCAFKITDASEGETVQVQVAFGTINDRVPDGMVLGEPFLLPVSDSGFVYAVLVFDPVTLVLSLDPGSVTLSYETEAQANTATVQYILLGVVTVTDGVISEVYSVCTQPVANPCQLAWEEPV